MRPDHVSRTFACAVLMMAAIALAGCSPKPEETPALSSVPAATPRAAETAEPAATSPAAAPEPTASPTPDATPAPEVTPQPQTTPAAAAPEETTTAATSETTTSPTAAAAWPENAPDVFKVRFEFSNGPVVAEFHKQWAPIGVEHFYQLVKMNYYDEARIFRVVPGFVIQFGINADPALSAVWSEKTIMDDPVLQSNTPGMITYAKGNPPNTRSTQLFINLGDNSQLDSMAFAPIGRVIEGMENVQGVFSEYGEAPSRAQDMIQMQGNAFLNQNFPRLDFIKTARLIR